MACLFNGISTDIFAKLIYIKIENINHNNKNKNII